MSFSLNTSISEDLLQIEKTLCEQVNSLKFSSPVEYVYSPIEYAFDIHAQFVRKFCSSSKKVLFLGMNPGPWGMSQTGVPFGEISVVKNWLCLSGRVDRPPREHPSRKIDGLDCNRSEVSGKRFWALFQELCGPDPHAFFQDCFVYNHCPVSLLTETGRNITPVELTASESKALLHICDAALVKVLTLLQVEIVIAIGRFAEKRVSIAIKNTGLRKLKVVYIPHPSPRNARINHGWKEETKELLKRIGILDLFQSVREER